MVTTSLANERVRYARALYRERVRTREQRFVIEGTRSVAEALRAGVRPVLAFYTGRVRTLEQGEALLARLRQAAECLIEVTPEVMASMAQTVTPQGVLAVVSMPRLPWPAHGLVVILDSLRDPGNVGTIMRAAWAAGAAGLATTRGTVDPFAPKVVRAAMGAHWGLPLQ
ncbi:MAG TPA: RNA methyltransferase substrate-binding domain-containing protein, partial [Anaerolineae bacterium]|nr:RNA methyltransferase substrate-binding domain-containing protein [Anaerolineae bacterium]